MSTTTKPVVKMHNAALDEQNGEIILRGVLDNDSLDNLLVADYQREVRPKHGIMEITEAMKKESVPDIELGMRGGNYAEGYKGNFTLLNDVYIVDGLQRKTAAVELLRKGGNPRLGATVHFNTNDEWERERFKILNIKHLKISPAVILRNEAKKNPGLEMMLNLCSDADFVLFKRVNWNQYMRREHIITAMNFIKASAYLHANLAPGLRHQHLDSMMPNWNRAVSTLGRTTVRNNIKEFWEVLDDCFGVRTIQFREHASHIKLGFLLAFSRLLGNHQNFWRDAKLFVPADLKKKISSFPLTDPHIKSQCGSSRAGANFLYDTLVKHINSGKRTHRLTPIKVKATETNGE